MKKPITVVTGIHAESMSATVLSLMLDLPDAVVVRHRIDLERSVLVRVVSDITGVVEHEEIDLEHACVPCAVREDVVPTLERVARDERWGSVIAQLPVAAGADQVCHVLAQEKNVLRALRINSVVAAVAGPQVVDDLLGDDLLPDRGLGTSDTDRRGVGETLAELVEYADVVVLVDGAAPAGVDLVRALARPEARLVTGSEQADGSLATDFLHQLRRTKLWTSPVRAFELPPLEPGAAWRVDLSADRPFHPGRLLAGLEQLGAGRHRSRGCFWLPSRPGDVLAWSGAGGQVSIGTSQQWGPIPRLTRLVLVGVGIAPDHLPHAFAELLVQPGEEVGRTTYEDGFEPWLGPIRDVA